MLNNIEMKIETELCEKTAIFKIYNDLCAKNVVNESLLDALSTEIRKLQVLYKNDQINSLIITASRNNAFLGGINLNYLRESENRDEILGFCEKAQKVFTALRNMPFPSIAAINGECIAGGFELALACQYRILADCRKNIVGLPNIELGIIPGLSGTSRLPRLIGLERAIEVICSGRTFLPREALKFGLVDEVVPAELLMDIAIRGIKRWDEKLKYRNNFLHKIHKGTLLRRFKRTFPGICLTRKLAERRLFRNNAKKAVSSKILDVLVEASFKEPENVFKIEREAFADLLLMPKPESYAKNLIESRFMRNELENSIIVSDIDFKVQKKVTIVGAGKVGRELAYFLASKKVAVRLIDSSPELLTKAMLNAKRLAEDEARIGRINKFEARRIIDFINPGQEFTGFQGIELVFETERENIKQKQKTLEMIEKQVDRETLVVSCSASLSIDEISRDMINPERFVGVHFGYPMLTKPLVEIVKAKRTSNLNFRRVYCWLLEYCRIPVNTSDKAGFLINRLQIPYHVETAWLVLEGANPAVIDGTMDSFGISVGPCKTIDELGINEFSDISANLSKAYPEKSFASGLTTKMADRGCLGKDSGAGFFKYTKNADGGRVRRSNPQLKLITRSLRLALNMTGAPRRIDSDEILKRLTSVLVNEASYAMEERIVDTPRILDAGAIYGLGFPGFKGGLLRFADNFGISQIVESLDNWHKTPPEFESVYGKMPLDFKEQKSRENGRRFAVSPLFRELAESKAGFYSIADTKFVKDAEDKVVEDEVAEIAPAAEPETSETACKTSVDDSEYEETTEKAEIDDASVKEEIDEHADSDETVETPETPEPEPAENVEKSTESEIESEEVFTESEKAAEYPDTEYFEPVEPTFIPDAEANEPEISVEGTNFHEEDAVFAEPAEVFAGTDENTTPFLENEDDFAGFDDDSDPFAGASEDFIQDAEMFSEPGFEAPNLSNIVETQDTDAPENDVPPDSDSDLEKNSD
ncbi:MAG: enoyl-CoA hydratase/isomerase family protein [Planctomycetes bacterium]|nr:enoyl-CoA hydratase/isomerase family protein [Planctomycetota bacterium]